MARAPWRDALDAKLRLMRYFETDEFIMHHRILLEGTHKERAVEQLHAYFRDRIALAEPIWVSTKIAQGIVNNLCDENTEFNIRDTAIPKHGLIWFERPLSYITDRPDGPPYTKIIRGILYSSGPDRHGKEGIMSCAWQQMSDGLAPIALDPIGYGQDVHGWIGHRAIQMQEDIKNPKVREYLTRTAVQGNNGELDVVESVRYLYASTILAMYTLFSFMEQRILVTPTQPVERAARRDAERHNVPSDVRVVTWRLKKYEHMETESNHIDWSCHWSSKAHDRHLADGRVVPVRASIKGDTSKPYKPPTPNVHVVTRQ